MDKLLVNIWPDGGKMLSLGRSTMFELVRTGVLPTVRVGRRRLIPATALEVFADRLIAEQTTIDSPSAA